jgi:hypothetical protein
MRASGIRSALLTAWVVSLVTGGCTAPAAMGTARAPVAAGAPAGASPGSTGYAVSGVLEAVAATSATDAWAIGYHGYGNPPLIVHWNGIKWSSVPAGVPAGSVLRAVAASSPGNAWIAGDIGTTPGLSQTPVILHWNGRAWRQVPFSAPPGTVLSSVSVTSPSNAWAVGSYPTSGDRLAGHPRPIALHWNGSAWRRVPLPKMAIPAGEGAWLTGVSATSASNAWALGTGFILHWNGRSWSQVPSAPARAGHPIAVVATATDYAWLLGAVAGRWNGRDWTTVPMPLVNMHGNGRGGDVLALAASGHIAWVAGTYCTSPAPCADGQVLPLLLRWTGNGWKLTPPPTGNVGIVGLAATSSTNAWAVGSTQPRTTLILHWNGSKWS